MYDIIQSKSVVCVYFQYRLGNESYQMILNLRAPHNLAKQIFICCKLIQITGNCLKWNAINYQGNEPNLLIYSKNKPTRTPFTNINAFTITVNIYI